MIAPVLRVDDPTAPHVADLLAFHLKELRGEMAEFAFALDATGLAQPEVTFWTAWVGDLLAGFVALKEIGDGSGELKSMRAAPAMRGKGIGRALLDHVIAEGRQRGLVRIDLETGTAELHAPAQPNSASGLGSWSLNGISSVIDTAPNRSASWLVDIDRLALPGAALS